MPKKASEPETARAAEKESHGKGKSIPSPDGTRIIAFANFKGGVGKTSCAINVAGCLSYQFGRKTLLVDLDVQSSLGQWLMGPQQWANWCKQKSKTSLQIFDDIIMGSHAWSVANSTWLHPDCGSLRICPATFDMLDLDNKLHYALDKPLHPKPFQCLDIQLKKVAAGFDYVILDCPPNMYMTTQNAVFAADFIVIPSVADFLSTAGLKRLVGRLNDLREQFQLYDTNPVKIAGIAINMFDQKIKLMEETVQSLEKYVAEKKHEGKVFLRDARVFSKRVRKLANIAKSQEVNKPVTVAFPESEAAKDFIQLTYEMMEVMGDAPAPEH